MKPQPTDSSSGHYVLVFFSAALVLLAYRDFNVSFLGSFAALAIAARGVRLAKGRRIWLLLLGVPILTIHGCLYQKKVLEADFAPLIERLGAYREEHGTYPESLDAVRGVGVTCRNRIAPSPTYRTSKMERLFV